MGTVEEMAEGHLVHLDSGVTQEGSRVEDHMAEVQEVQEVPEVPADREETPVDQVLEYQTWEESLETWHHQSWLCRVRSQANEVRSNQLSSG